MVEGKSARLRPYPAMAGWKRVQPSSSDHQGALPLNRLGPRWFGVSGETARCSWAWFLGGAGGVRRGTLTLVPGGPVWNLVVGSGTGRSGVEPRLCHDYREVRCRTPRHAPTPPRTLRLQHHDEAPKPPSPEVSTFVGLVLLVQRSIMIAAVSSEPAMSVRWFPDCLAGIGAARWTLARTFRHVFGADLRQHSSTDLSHDYGAPRVRPQVGPQV